MAGTGPDVLEMLSAVDWEFLLKWTIVYAAGHLNRLRWRGAVGGLLPDGHNPGSIALQAITDFLQEHAPLGAQAQSSSNFQSNPAAISPSPIANRGELLRTRDEIRRKLERLVRKHVNRLHHRKENPLLRNEPDLAPVLLDDGEMVSVIELIPAPDLSPAEALIHKEASIEFLESKILFATFLARERRLARMLDLLCDGICKPRDLASRLKLGIRNIENLRQRLQRRWIEFSRLQGARK